MARRQTLFAGGACLLVVICAVTAFLTLGRGSEPDADARAAGGSAGTASRPADGSAGTVEQPADGAAGAPATAAPPRPGIPGSADAVLSGEEAADAVCSVRPSGLEVLTRIAPGVSPIENLRDGLPLLQEKITQLGMAAEGRPTLTPTVERLESVATSWGKAIRFQDAGKEDMATRLMAAAEAEIAAVDTDLDTAYAGWETSCGGR